MIGVLLLSVCVIGLVMLAMAVGALVSGRCLRGSCGAPFDTDPARRALQCDTCPVRAEAQRRKAAGRGAASHPE